MRSRQNNRTRNCRYFQVFVSSLLSAFFIISSATNVHAENHPASKKVKPVESKPKAASKSETKTESKIEAKKDEKTADSSSDSEKQNAASGSSHPTNLFDDIGLKGNKSQSDAPLFVKSKTLSLDSKTRIFTYRGDVQADRGDLRITSDKMTGKYDEKSQIQTITAEGDVVITRTEAMRATSNRAVYNVPKAIIEMTEGPELQRQGNALTADKVTIYVDEDRSEAEGNVQVKVLKADPNASGATKRPSDQKANDKKG